MVARRMAAVGTGIRREITDPAVVVDGGTAVAVAVAEGIGGAGPFKQFQA